MVVFIGFKISKEVKKGNGVKRRQTFMVFISDILSSKAVLTKSDKQILKVIF
jgi:hypothetical protein